MGARSRSRLIVDTSAQNFMVRFLVASSPVYRRASVNKLAEGLGDRRGRAEMSTFSNPTWSIILEVSMTLKDVGAPPLWS